MHGRAARKREREGRVKGGGEGEGEAWVLRQGASLKGGKGVGGGRGLGFEVGGEPVADGLDDERRRRRLAVAP